MTETNNIQISNIQNDEEYVQAFILYVGKEETHKSNYDIINDKEYTLIAKKSNEVVGLITSCKENDSNESITQVFTKEGQDQSYISNILQKYIKKEVQDQDKNKIKEGKKENTSEESN